VMGSHLLFCPSWPGMSTFLISASHVARRTDMCHHAQLLAGVSQTTCPDWSWTSILQISASQVANRHEPPVPGNSSHFYAGINSIF
jgi:hypothetical protein